MLLSLLLGNVTTAHAAKPESPEIVCGEVCVPAEPFENAVYLPGIVREPQPSSPHSVVDPSPDWTAEWWQWVESLSNVPIMEEGNIDCTNGQLDAVWFLAGTQGGTPVVRSCTVPSDKTFLAPVFTVSWNNEAGENLSVDEKRKVLADIFSDQEPGLLNSEICHEESTIDGTSVNATQIQSPSFQLRLDPEAVSDGFWFAFQLEPGNHQIHFIGRLCDFGTTNIQSEVNVTYNLTVNE
jgi:hypothetical protein